MTSYLSGRLWWVWLALVVATALSWWTAAAHPFGASATRLGAAVALAIGLGKAWLIGMHFMDLREAPRPLRMAFTIWATLVGAVLAALVLL